MRLLVLFLVCSIGLSYAADSYAQKAMISIDVHNQRVEDILKEIEAQSDFDFFFNNKHVDLNRRVSVSADKSNIFSVLKEIFAGTNVKYSVLDKKIILSVEAQSPQQEKKVTVSGTVLDTHGEPVIGASVLEKGVQGNGTITDIDGIFKLSVSSSKAQLDISYIGYQSQTVAVQVGKNLKIILQEDSKQLEEVVVVGYGTQSKKTLTGAVSMVNMGDVEMNTVPNVSRALAGKAAGFRVNQISAQPGGEAKFRIRGEASTGAGNDPLFVIDGFPVSSSGNLSSGNGYYESGNIDNVLESLNPDDIESISVLKDAASTAIYGARAGHGVVLITTKRGKSQKPRVTYSGMGSVQVARSNYKMLDTRMYMDMYNKQQHEEWLKLNGMGIYEGYVGKPDTPPTQYKPAFNNDEILLASGTDWLDAVMRNGYTQQHNLSVNGGTEKTRYLASVNYMDQEGIVKNNGVSRFSARLNLDQELSKYVSFGLTATYSQNKYDNVPLGDKVNEYSGVLTGAIQSNPTIPIYDSEGNYFIDPKRPFVANPVSLLEIKDNTVKDRLIGSAFVSVKPLKELEVKLQLGADRSFQKRSSYLPKTTLQGANKNGRADISQETSTTYLMELTAQYSKSFGDHNLKAIGGYSFQKFKNDGFSAGNSDFLVDGFGYNSLGSGNYKKPSVSSWASINSIASLFARANYSYKGKYLLEATVRADAASNFAPENRWGYFPSVSAGWMISEENFMKGASKWLSMLKLRASYGQTGNSNVGYRIYDYYEVGRNAIIGGAESTGVYASDLGNKSITWETTTEFNLGVDFGIFNNRFKLAAEYFKRKITDLLVTNKPLPFYNEVNKIAGNIGSTQSQGVEITLNTVNIVTKDFEWDTTLTLSHYNDRWLKRDPNWKPRAYEKEDDPIRAWWEYEAIGILQPGEKAPDAQKDLVPGMMKLKDRDGNGVLGDEDKVYMGNGDPKIIYGLNNSFRYKNFDLNAFFVYAGGNKLRNSVLKMDDQLGTQTLKGIANRWTADDSNAQVRMYLDIPAQVKTYATTFQDWWQFGDINVKDAGYVKLRSLSVGYNLPFMVCQYLRLSSLKVKVQVNNLFTWCKAGSDIDPESYGMNDGTRGIASPKTYSIGLSTSF